MKYKCLSCGKNSLIETGFHLNSGEPNKLLDFCKMDCLITWVEKIYPLLNKSLKEHEQRLNQLENVS